MGNLETTVILVHYLRVTVILYSLMAKLYTTFKFYSNTKPRTIKENKRKIST